MQINTNATSEELATAFASVEQTIATLESIDTSPVADAGVELLRDRQSIIVHELTLRGLRECGNCKAATPGAVDWGCVCSMTADEQAADAAEFARIHD